MKWIGIEEYRPERIVIERYRLARTVVSTLPCCFRIALLQKKVALSEEAKLPWEKLLENEFFSRSGKNQATLWIAREIWKGLGKSGKSQGN